METVVSASLLPQEMLVVRRSCGGSTVPVRRLRARRAKRRAVPAEFDSATAIVGATVTMSGSRFASPCAGSLGTETRPSVQGSTFDQTARWVERKGVGVWVAARRGPGALAAPRLSAEAAPSAIPSSRLVLQRQVAVCVEVQGKDLDELTNAANVGQLLSAMGIEPDADDRVASPLQTPLHPSEVVRFAGSTSER
jgi:hypothetical protein